MHIVSVVNQKGGVAKTTTCANLAACLARRNYRTLLINLDPQANLTLGLHRAWAPLPYGLSEVLRAPDTRPLAPLLRPLGDAPLYLAPGHMDLARSEALLPAAPEPVTRLRRALAPLVQAAGFDWVLIDCPPSLGLLTQNALAASAHLLIPTEPKFYAFAGMDTLNTLVVGLAQEGHVHLQLLGVVLTLVETQARLHKTIAAEIRARFGNKVFDTVIHKNARLAEAEVEGVPIVTFDKRARSARDYEALTEEIVQRLAPSP